MRKVTLSIAAAVVALASILAIAPNPLRADENGNGTVPTGTLRNVAGIVTHSGGRSVQVGTAFFVAVPSLAFPGRSFVYLVTAHHNLLDGYGKPRDGLLLTLEDSKTGTMREEPLPLENRWVLDPNEEKADVAAIPLTPQGASIAPIALASLLGSDDPFARPETGAQVYYLTAATVGVNQHRFEALARFGHVSVPAPADTEVIGAGLQQLSYLDGGGAPGFSSGAPVFVSAGLRFALWGILEANTSLNTDPVFSGLAGVLPAKYVAETVKKMGEVQDKTLQGSKAPAKLE
ncbi:hypothetical protein [Candidatus Binatus sp.]|uniref:hypothetical protein n=1 Tax=Candidatus Binatus sp. TaxID=2811406 RepID=UPI003CC518C8